MIFQIEDLLSFFNDRKKIYEKEMQIRLQLVLINIIKMDQFVFFFSIDLYWITFYSHMSP